MCQLSHARPERLAVSTERHGRLRAGAACAALVFVSSACSTGSADAQLFRQGRAAGRTGDCATSRARSPSRSTRQCRAGQPDARIMHGALRRADRDTTRRQRSRFPRWPSAGSPTRTTRRSPSICARRNWSDGAPITADDFVYSIRRGLEPATAARTAYMAYDISNAQAFNEGAVFARDGAPVRS